MKLQIKLSEPEALPVRAHPTDAGLDLKTMVNIVLYPGESVVIPTGVSVKIPEGFAGLAFSRSGHGKLKVRLSNSVGLIDSPYHGELKVILENEGEEPFRAIKGDRIAQLVIVPIITPELEIYDGPEDQWIQSERGANGFGSTNK